MAKYPRIILPEDYLEKLLTVGVQPAVGNPEWFRQRGIREHGLLLCDYCIDDYAKITGQPKMLRTGGWLTNEKCPFHKRTWLKLWFVIY